MSTCQSAQNGAVIEAINVTVASDNISVMACLLIIYNFMLHLMSWLINLAPHCVSHSLSQICTV